MKKLVLALTAVAAFTGSALAADLARPHAYTKAPPPMRRLRAGPASTSSAAAAAASGMLTPALGSPRRALPLSINQRQGGDGWFGTVGAGYDWQFNGTWVFGIFADGQFGSLKGTIQDPIAVSTGIEKMQDAWAAGARLGYLVAPNVLSYVNGGYTGSHWSGTTLLNTFSGLPVGLATPIRSTATARSSAAASRTT